MYDDSMKKYKEFIPPTLLLLVSIWYQSLGLGFGICLKKLEDLAIHREEQGDFFLNTHFEGAWSNIVNREERRLPTSAATKSDGRKVHVRSTRADLVFCLASLFGTWICYF